MQSIPSLDGLSWSKIRALAKGLAADEAVHEVVAAALVLVDAPDAPHRMLGVYVLGFTSGAFPENLVTLRERVASDPSWEVQEALAQAI